MGRSLRSKRLRSVLYRAANGKCLICGCELPHNWHADHIVPWSVSKRTNVHEMQALCPKCNLKKREKMPSSLRQHQSEILEIGQAAAAGKRRGFRILCHIVCGGGKSWLPPLLLSKMPTTMKLCWVVPRLALQGQAVRDSLKGHGLEIRDSGNDCDPSRGMRGVAITHQAFASQPELWRQEFTRSNYLLVIDEPHHAKVDRDGSLRPLSAAIEKCEDKCIGLMYMTGTLATGDGNLIYGVEYAGLGPNGGMVPTELGFDYYVRYSRKDALQENSIVPINFFHDDGPVSWESLSSGKITETKLSAVDKKDEGKAIYTALNTSLAESLFDRGYQHWKRKGDKLIVVCDRQDKAKRYHQKLLQLGEKSFLAIQDNDTSLVDIDKFKETDRGCLVTCAMAYEGLDEKRLSHIICLTHIRSTPWIEQALARVWRACPETGKTECFAFVPDDPRMNRVIREIKSEEAEEILYRESGGGGGDGPRESDIIPVGSHCDETRCSSLDGDAEGNGNETFNDKQWQARQYLESIGVPVESVAMSAVMETLSMAVTSQLSERFLTPKQREDEFKRKIADKCRQMDIVTGKKFHGSDYGHHQYMVKQYIGKPMDLMNQDDLRRAWNYVEKLNAR